MNHGIGAHNGSLPRHIVTSEIELFNKKIINVLFATTSLIEGVNTAAKNMFIYSQYKGKDIKIDFFDFANIRGRAGRMNQYFTGNVFLFFEEPDKEDFVIDVPSIEQNKVSDEILINIPENEIKDKVRKDNLVMGLDDDLVKIIRRNLISIRGQIKLYNYIEENKQSLSLLNWNSTNVTYEKLRMTLFLGYKYLYETDNSKFINKQTANSLKIANGTSIKQMIFELADYYRKKNKSEPLKRAISEILYFQRQDAGFKIPKILSVVDSIQRYVFEKSNLPYGDYTVFASMLENERVQDNLQFLIDFGVPSSALKKIAIVPVDLNNQEVLDTIKKNFDTIEKQLLPYEISLLEKSLH